MWILRWVKTPVSVDPSEFPELDWWFRNSSMDRGWVAPVTPPVVTPVEMNGPLTTAIEAWPTPGTDSSETMTSPTTHRCRELGGANPGVDPPLASRVTFPTARSGLAISTISGGTGHHPPPGTSYSV